MFQRLYELAVFCFRNLIVTFLLLPFLFGLPAQAQNLNQGPGPATRVDLVAVARGLDMQDPYARALFLYLQAKPGRMDNQNFYLNFLTYLFSQVPDFNCRDAFASEFERKDFFRKSFALKDQFMSIIQQARITQRYDVLYSIDTGRYDFTTGRLPFSEIGIAIGDVPKSVEMSSYCGERMLRGTSVDRSQFPWSFTVVDETARESGLQFPFGNELTLSEADARTLFSRFGRSLNAIVSYKFQVANNGSQKIQIFATDGQLFGLSSDAVVRIKSYRHPVHGQQSYLDITNPLSIDFAALGIETDLHFQQQGFRAVGQGASQGRGTELTTGSNSQIQGSAAVGSSSFVMRLAVPNIPPRLSGLKYNENAERYMTIYGKIDLVNASPRQVPVIGYATVLQVSDDGAVSASRPLNFTGRFTPAGQEPPADIQDEPESILEEMPDELAAPGSE